MKSPKRNHSFHDKTIADFVEIKKEKLSLVKSWKRQRRICSSGSMLIENNGIDLKSFSRGTFPNHLISIRDGKYNKTKPFTSLMILAINKTAKDRALIENIIPS
jgi:hypothetical protein